MRALRLNKRRRAAARKRKHSRTRNRNLQRAHQRARERGVRPLVYWPVRFVLQSIFVVYFRLTRSGLEHIPAQGPFVLAANHRSYLDPIALGLLTRRPMHYVAKSELFENRFIGWLLNALGGFPVRRGLGDAEAIETAVAILERGEGVVIFPEGTRVRKESLGRPRRGLGHIALASRAPVVPAAIAGTDKVRRRKFLFAPTRIGVSAAKAQNFPMPDWSSPRLAGSVIERVWPQVVAQWEQLNGGVTEPEQAIDETESGTGELMQFDAATTDASKPRYPVAQVELEAVREYQPGARMTPIERLRALADPGSFELLNAGAARATDGLLLARVRVQGQPVFAYAQDLSRLGGSLSAAHADAIVGLMRQAANAPGPVVGFVESGGARLQEGVAALDGYGRIFKQHALLSGHVPQISVVCGVAAGGSAYGPALGDFVVMTEEAATFLTGPTVVHEVTGERIDKAGLGGPDVHSRNGVGHFMAADDAAAIKTVHRLLALLPQSSDATPKAISPVSPRVDDLESIVPDNPRKTYDIRRAIDGLVDATVDGVEGASAENDASSALEFAPDWAPNLVCAFARLGGRPIGVIANQPNQLAGVLDAESAQKGARFVNSCDAFGIPLLVLVDTPGFLPGRDQESGAVIRHGACLVRAFTDASVPSVTVVLRKSFGGAHIAMNSRALGANHAFAWPGAQIGVMGSEQAVGILHRREIAAAEEPDVVRRALAEAYATQHLGASEAAAAGFIDAVIAPGETRARVWDAFDVSDPARIARPQAAKSAL